MTSEEFHELVEQYGEPVPEAGGDRPLTLAQIAEMEREMGIIATFLISWLSSVLASGTMKMKTTRSDRRMG